MAQLEQRRQPRPVEHPDHRLITLILMRCGLRIGDALRLPRDCMVRDADGAPYLRYFNHKMKREALVPIDEELEHAIGNQHQRLHDRWPQGTARAVPAGHRQPRRPPSDWRTRPTAGRYAAGWNAATSATSTASPST